MKKIAYAKQQGSYHKAKNIPCQDYVSGQKTADACVIALADGAGSYETAELAAKAAVDIAVNSLSSDFDYWYYMDMESFREEFISMCRDAVWSAGRELDAACTLLVYAVSSDERDIAIHIGDGYIFGRKYNDELTVVSYPENGEEPNQTFFLSDFNAPQHLHVVKNEFTDYSGVMLCSDGASAALIDRSNDRLATAIGKLISTVQIMDEKTAAEMMDSALDTMFRVHSPDDMSIGIMAEEL